MASWTQYVIPALIAAVVALTVGISTILTTRAGWRREAEREHRRWAREQRVTAYLEFLDRCWECCVNARDQYWEAPDLTREPQWYEEVNRALLRVEAFGSPEVAEQARSTVKAVAKAIDEESRGQWAGSFIPGGEGEVLLPFIDAMRRDLGIGANGIGGLMAGVALPRRGPDESDPESQTSASLDA
ncbi:hypothetical protein [Catenuloplanes indicus]|uniref:Uncharacterized protein n=1 Tax=Catenuloplanes indicus TaxID=137267 RepID=A0AAE4AV66_9ACTN|nr:hypothetical protein [Catenuloplanes indicus]MDQ0363406.1 hypothetical protein [Catenuloplanes indicus]